MNQILVLLAALAVAWWAIRAEDICPKLNRKDKRVKVSEIRAEEQWSLFRLLVCAACGVAILGVLAQWFHI